MRIVLDQNAIAPTRAHATDAGLDLYARETQTIPARGYASFDTGVHVEIPEGCAGILISKSGLNVKDNITSTGLIDEGYTGSIVVKLYNNGFFDFRIERGMKISQLVIVPVRYEEVEIAESLSKTERGDKGFGSTGR